MTVVSPGRRVRLLFAGENQGFIGTVEEVQIGRGQVVSYRVAYWLDAELKIVVLDSTEILPLDPTEVREIGFVS